MGCGKSSVGARLAAMLHCRHADLDALVTEAAGMSIPEIFASEGEEGFRSRELEALKAALAVPDRDFVLSLGGGTPTRSEAREVLRKAGAVCIYLRAGAGTIRGRLSGEGIKARPMLQKRPLEELISERSPIYESLADLVLDTDELSAQEVAQVLAAELESRRAHA